MSSPPRAGDVGSAAAGATARSPLGGRFITFEGIDGCGKTLQMGWLGRRLEPLGHPIVQSREPGGTAIGKGLRSVLLDAANAVMTPQCEVLLYLADRIQHLAEVIRPALTRGDLVLCDRFHDATLAYQKYGRGLDFGPLETLIAREITPMPDLTFWLDVDVATARGRIATRQRGNRTLARTESRIDEDAPDFHERVREGYGELARLNPERIVRIDASLSIETVHAEIWRKLTERYAVE
jgi:dTMP kinase